MELPKLNSVKECPKCLAVESSLINANRFTYKYRFTTMDIREIGFMDRSCYRCGYEWSEQCADYEENQGEVGSTGSENYIQCGVTDYLGLFSKEHFQDADQIGQSIISNLKEKGYKKTSSTKCQAQYGFISNHSSFFVYCSLPKNHLGNHQIKIKDNSNIEHTLQFSDSEIKKESY